MRRRSSIAHCPLAVWRCTTGVPLPGIMAVYRRRSIAQCPKAPRQRADCTGRRSDKESQERPCTQAAVHGDGSCPVTGAQHTTHSTRSHTQPPRFALHVCKAPPPLQSGASAFSTPHHNTPQDTTQRHTSPHPTPPHHPTPHQTTPHHTPPHPITPHHTPPHPTTPHHTPPHPTTPHHTPPHPNLPHPNHTPPSPCLFLCRRAYALRLHILPSHCA